MKKIETITRVEKFIQESRELGYRIEGSVFKVDFNGSVYNVGFWIRPDVLCDKNLGYRCGKAKHPV